MRLFFWAFVAITNIALTATTVWAMLYTFGWITTLAIYGIGAVTIGLQIHQAFVESRQPTWAEPHDDQYDELAAKVNAARQEC